MGSLRVRNSPGESRFCPLPEIVSGQADMGPAHWGKVGEERVIEKDAGCCEVLGGPVQIDGIPICYRRDQQVQTRCPIFLVLDRPVREPTLPVGVDGGGEGMACFPLVEAGLAGPA